VKAAIFPAVRAVEHATSLDGVLPLRLFPVLWPLWRVETTANVYEERAYEVIDRFLVLAIRDVTLHTVEELAGFFGVPVPLVQRCVDFLTVIDHVRTEDGVVTLTELGRVSAADEVRYELRKSRQDIFVEQFTAQPLLRPYYEGSVPVLDSADVPADRIKGGSRFQPLYAPAQFRDETVLELSRREDRPDYNLPRLLRDLTVVGHQPAFLPGYVIETADSGLLVYTALAAERDAFFERVASHVPVLDQLISAERGPGPLEIWTDWLAGGRGPGILSQLPSGVWRVTLRADAFGRSPKRPLFRVGSYELRKRHFLQLWCEDTALRTRALNERALAMTANFSLTKAGLLQDVAALARQLDVPEPDLADLRRFAEQDGRRTVMARLDSLE
jgi:hypothetical protein